MDGVIIAIALDHLEIIDLKMLTEDKIKLLEQSIKANEEYLNNMLHYFPWLVHKT
jgi:hypothetical protein